MNNKYILRALVAVGAVASLASCSSKMPLTSSLFRQAGRPHIYLPTQKEEKTATLTERVKYQTTVDTIRNAPRQDFSKQDSSMKSFELDAFTVVAERPKVKISTIRNGMITLNFLVSLPKHFMDQRWQVVLTPQLINGDSISALPPMVLQGSQFRALQNAQYDKYDKFEKGIVDTAKYDSAFFDNKKLNHYITALQRQYLDQYRTDYRNVSRYVKWRHQIDDRYLYYGELAMMHYDQDVDRGALKLLTEAYERDLAGKDSTKTRQLIAKKYDESRRLQEIDKRTRKLTIKQVPLDFRTYYRRNWTLDSIRNRSVTERDSLDFARYTYDRKGIAENETKRNHTDMFRRRIIKFPRIEGAHMTDTVMPGGDMMYMYSEDIPVTPDLQRKLQVVLETKVSAIDGSTWWQASQDTLNFVVSGMNDLMDKTQIDRLEGADRETYQQGLDRLAVRDYRGALDILQAYPDYNAAVCLIALGYNEQAANFLEYLRPANGNVDYLKAVVKVRMGELDAARELLISAVRKDPRLAYKAEIEPEFTSLYDADSTLLPKLLAIGDGEDEEETSEGF